MFGWKRGAAGIGHTGSQGNFGQVYSLATDFAYARHPWVAHPVLQVTATCVFVDFQGQPRSLNRAKLERDGWAFSSGVCFYSESTMRQIRVGWASVGEGAAPKPHPPQVGDESDLLGLGPTYTRAEVMASFRRRAFDLHPDKGGDPRTFGRLVEARMRALARIRR